MDTKRFKIEGYLFTVADGDYSDYTEKRYLFKEIPNMEQIKEEVDKAWEEVNTKLIEKL